MANEKHLTILAEATELTEHEIQEDLEKPESETPYHILTVYDGLRCLELLQSEHDKEMEKKDWSVESYKSSVDSFNEKISGQQYTIKKLLEGNEMLSETIRQLRGEIDRMNNGAGDSIKFLVSTKLLHIRIDEAIKLGVDEFRFEQDNLLFIKDDVPVVQVGLVSWGAPCEMLFEPHKWSQLSAMMKCLGEQPGTIYFTQTSDKSFEFNIRHLSI